ncbi:MAG: tRNA (guanosine(46)-N7)-methyltransferase TrmB [Verrucomicrobia bacterium]|nr:tRNA (guanosine(46)-N7)-methyltransferase TrmB [Verrucomicrobiota bacterium]
MRNSRPDILAFQDHVIIPDPDAPTLHMAELYGNDNPLEVDIGSGKGRFLIARAHKHPDVNYLGIERQLGRVYRTAKKADHRGLTNIKVTQVEARLGLSEMLPDESVTTFYIFFPDPWPKRRHERRRLVSQPFLDLLHSKLAPRGCIHFATDHKDYAEATAIVFGDDARFSSIPPFEPSEDELTDFELIFTAQSKPTNRLSIQKQ